MTDQNAGNNKLGFDDPFADKIVELAKGFNSITNNDLADSLLFACEEIVLYREIVSVYRKLFDMMPPLNSPRKRRGRPNEYTYPFGGNRGLRVPKSLLRGQTPKTGKVGAPQKYDYGNLTTKVVAMEVAVFSKEHPDLSMRECVRHVLGQKGIEYNQKQVKQLADLAGRIFRR